MANLHITVYKYIKNLCMGLYSIVNIEQEKHFISMHTQSYPFTRPTLRSDKIERGVARETEAVFSLCCLFP